MAGKFMKIKRLVIPMLVLIAILAQTTPAFALEASEMADLMASSPSVTMEYADVDAVTGASPMLTDNHDGTFTYDRTGVVVNERNEQIGQTEARLTMLAANTSVKQGSFTDVDSSKYAWTKGAIDTMVSKGIMKGYGDGRFGPQDNVTREQFLVMAVRAFGDIESMKAATDKLVAANPEDYTSLDVINDAYKSENGTPHWSNEYVYASQSIQALDGTFGVNDLNWKQAANRADMAAIVLSVMEANGKNLTITDGIDRNIGDYGQVRNSNFADYILKAYSAGILVGTNSNGDYEPLGLSTRAQAAVVMNRAIDPSKRETVTVKPETPKPPVQEGANVGQYAVYPKEGDMFNGKPITRDPVTGVLGFGNGQKGGIYNGITLTSATNSYTIKVGEYASESYDNMREGSKYTEKSGYIYWDSEWELIDAAARRNIEASGVKASAATKGTKADINGNIIAKGDKTTPVFWEVDDMGDPNAFAWMRTQ